MASSAFPLLLRQFSSRVSLLEKPIEEGAAGIGGDLLGIVSGVHRMGADARTKAGQGRGWGFF
jgi:hypothetical protein